MIQLGNRRAIALGSWAWGLGYWVLSVGLSVLKRRPRVYLKCWTAWFCPWREKAPDSPQRTSKFINACEGSLERRVAGHNKYSKIKGERWTGREPESHLWIIASRHAGRCGSSNISKFFGAERHVSHVSVNEALWLCLWLEFCSCDLFDFDCVLRSLYTVSN